MMDKKEKVLKGLICCTSADDWCNEDCPYYDKELPGDIDKCKHKLMTDAIEVIQMIN